jgi:tryptophanyl-tRNA synthetase
MFTDPKRIKLNDKGHPQVCNVFSYYCVFFPELKEEVFHWCTHARLGCTDCKRKLASGLVDKLKAFHKRRQDLLQDKAKIKKILQQGKEKATAVASNTLKEVKEAMKI